MVRTITRKRRKLPTGRRQYHTVIGIDSGLDYSQPSTMIAETFSPGCEEMTFRDGIAGKAYGVSVFADTEDTPLLGTFMFAYHYIKNNESDKLVVHTTTNVYVYNTTSELLECITPGTTIENCEDVWSVNANVTCAVDTDKRKGTNSVAITIATAFTTGVAAYENFGALDISSYTQLHFFVKSTVATSAGQLRIRLSEQNAGATGATYADYNVPALTAGEWKEVSVDLDAPDASDGGTYPDDLNAVLSVSLVVVTDIGAQEVNIDDVLATTEFTGDEDDTFSSIVVNDHYVFSNGIDNLWYYDLDDANASIALGTTNMGCKAMQMLGERLNLYHLPDLPRRVTWTIAGGLSTPPAATDWTNTGSGDTDLDSVFGDDVIVTALRMGNFVVIYGKKTIAMQEYIGLVSKPFNFFSRVRGIGTPAWRGVASLGDKHIVLGWDDVYLYKGGTDVESIGGRIRNELFRIINPTYIHRSFVVYLEEQHEVRIYFPLIGSEVPNCYFTYSLRNGSWSRGSRSYTGYGSFKKWSGGDTWDSIGTATTTWDEMTTRWDDRTNETLSALNLYGNSSGVMYMDNESVLNHVDAAIIAWVDTKDFVVGDAYRRNVTNWMEFNFEARGDSVEVSYSTNLGESYSAPVTFPLTDEWAMYSYHINVNSPQVRFRFKNDTVDETFEVREREIGFIPASDRGV